MSTELTENTETPEPTVWTDDDIGIDYSTARVMWENGEFSEWVEANGGWPITIDGEIIPPTKCESALSDDTWDEN